VRLDSDTPPAQERITRQTRFQSNPRIQHQASIRPDSLPDRDHHRAHEVSKLLLDRWRTRADGPSRDDHGPSRTVTKDPRNLRGGGLSTNTNDHAPDISDMVARIATAIALARTIALTVQGTRNLKYAIARLVARARLGR